MKIANLVKKQRKPLKRSKVGLEMEMHIIDDQGNISFKGFDLVKTINKRFPKADVVYECGKNMVEFGSYPSINTFNPAMDIINYFEKIIFVAKKSNLHVFPFGCYPGKFKPRFTPSPDGRYKIQENIFGKEKFGLATKITGFHHHYTMPKGVFDEESKDLKLLINSKLKRSLINSYNFEIAVDPILTLLSQSSPFVDGQHLAKSCRLLIYRGGKKLGYDGLYNNFQMFGGLPPYKQTATDLIHSLNRRKKRWFQLIKKAGGNPSQLYPFNLDVSWNPVKINKHGTIEQRGMDSNFLSILLGVSALLKFCLKKIHRDFVEVIPSDIGLSESFLIRDNIMFIPPHTHVRNVLQKASAYEGFANDELSEYTKRFFRFARPLAPSYYAPLLDKVKDMINRKRSVSDDMFDYARRKGFLNKQEGISNSNAKELALFFSKKFERDLKDTKLLVKKITKKHVSIFG